MANKHVKRCSTSLVVIKMQIKTTVIYYSAPIVTSKAIQSAGEDVEQINLSYVAGEIAKRTTILENSLAVS